MDLHTPAPRTLDEKGRCCGRKPLVYKREGKRFCCRCLMRCGLRATTESPLSRYIAEGHLADAGFWPGEDWNRCVRCRRALSDCQCEMSQGALAIVERLGPGAWKCDDCGGFAKLRHAWEHIPGEDEGGAEGDCKRCGSVDVSFYPRKVTL